MTATPTEDEGRVRRTAFRLLLGRREPIAPADLAPAAGIDPDCLGALLEQLHRAGRIRRNVEGAVTGSAGLSVVPDRHRIQVEGRTFWTWCAYDILGIFGALGAAGRAWSPSPGGPVLEIEFAAGRPQPTTAVLLRPDTELMASCQNVYEEWCPNSNLFRGSVEARAWASEHGINGQILGLDEASRLATSEWAELTTGLVL